MFSSRHVATVMAVTLGLAACETKKEGDAVRPVGQPTQAGDDSKTNDPVIASGKIPVMVIDTGFDTNSEVFKDKVLATYRIDCQDAEPNTTSVATTFAQQKAALLKELETPDESCVLRGGNNFTLPNSFKRIEQYRDQWNEFIKSKGANKPQSPIFASEQSFNNFMGIVSGVADKTIYHGTGTAGTIAYDNEKVSLVLVQKTLGSAGDEQGEGGVTCPTNADLAAEVKLLQDPDIQKAYIERPISSLDRDLAAVAKKYGVKLVNMSYGTNARAQVEADLRKKGCGTISFASYFQTLGTLDGKRDMYLDKQIPDRLNYLLVQSAGNEGAQVNGVADKMECGGRRSNLIFVGATTATGARADFSNYGTCVDVSALGDNVVLAAPNNFLNIESGTSFSAPLVVRYLSQNIKPTDDIKTIRSVLAQNAVGSLREVNAANPKELAWDDKSSAVDTYALVSATTQSIRRHVVPLPGSAGMPSLRYLGDN